MKPIGIAGTGSYVAPKVMTNPDWTKYVDTSDEWIYGKTGIRERRIADPSVATSDLAAEASALAHELRTGGVACELYLDAEHRLDKQLKYADRRRIPYVAFVGPDEKAAGTVVVKELASRSQRTVSRAGAAQEIGRP